MNSLQNDSHPPKFRITLAKRLAGIQLIFAVVLSLAIGGISYGLLSGLLDRTQHRRLRDNVSAVSSMTQNFLESNIRDLEQLLDEEVFDKYVYSFSDLVLLQHFQQYMQYFESVSYANRYGLEEVTQYRDGREVRLRDISATPLFRDAIAHPNQICLADSSNISSDITIPTIQLGVFMENYYDEQLGFVSVQIPLAALNAYMSQLSRDEEVRTIVADQGGRIVYDSQAEWFGRTLEKSSEQTELLGREGLMIFRAPFFDCNDCIISAGMVSEFGWRVFNLIRHDDYIAPLQQFRIKMAGMVAIVSIAVAAVVMLYLQFLLRPIRLLTETAHHIASSGDPDRCIEWTSRDDVGDLANSFNLMLKRLRSSQGELIDERARTENIISSMADPVIVTDRDNVTVKVNLAISGLLGQEESLLLGKNMLDLFAAEPTDLHQAITQKNFPSGYFQSVASVIIDKDKQRVYVSVSGALLRDAEGRVSGKVFVAKDITKLKQAHIRLHHLANYDSLTGLPNRQLLKERIGQMLERLPRHGRLVAVLFIDLDRFKLVNDTLGHSEGDRLIRVMAERLKKSVRNDDVVARFGGDEFVVLLNDVAKLEDVEVIVKKMLSLFVEPVILGGSPYTATGSIGVSTAPDQGNEPEILLKNADMAMYQAKRKGRNTYQVYSVDMHFDARSAFHLEVAMRQALEDEDYAVYFQPIIDARSREVVGVEALIRWETKDGNLRSPIEFLPIAEETGLILPLGRWILEHSFSQVKQWHDMGHQGITLSVNISNRQFRDPNFVATIEDMLRKTGLPPEKLNVELTEGILMQDLDRANMTLLDLKCLGAKISVDDFGTGYSSLAHLKRFSLDILKIDRSFVTGLPENKHDMAISKAIIGLAHTLELGVIAEGVETEEQAAFLKQNGAEMLQGYLFSKPVPADALQQILPQSEISPCTA